MIVAKMTNEYLEVLANGKLETWVRDCALNAETLLVANYKGKRYVVSTRMRVRLRALKVAGYKLSR